MIHIPFFPRSRTDTGDWTKEMVEKEKKRQQISGRRRIPRTFEIGNWITLTESKPASEKKSELQLVSDAHAQQLYTRGENQHLVSISLLPGNRNTLIESPEEPSSLKLFVPSSN